MVRRVDGGLDSLCSRSPTILYWTT